MGDFWKIMHGYFRNKTIADGIVSFKDVTHLAACSAYTMVYALGGISFRISKNIGKVATEMKVLDYFLCHRSYYVNLAHIVQLVYNKDGNEEWQAELPDKVFIKVCSDKADELALALHNYRKNRPMGPTLN